jgi:hypothetical protein
MMPQSSVAAQITQVHVLAWFDADFAASKAEIAL